MAKLTKEEIDEITRLQKEEFGGDLDQAIAAHVYSVGVVRKTRGVPPFANKRQLSNIRRQLSPAKPKADRPPKRKTK